MGVLVGLKAPDFTAAAVLSDGTIVDDFTLSERTQGQEYTGLEVQVGRL